MSKNFAMVLHGPLDLRYQEFPMPVIGENDVLIKMACVGICGSDVKFYTTAECGGYGLVAPTVLGHEGAGVVTQVGSNVTNLKVNDRVAIEPTQPCRTCDLCKHGRYNLCIKPRYCSTMDEHGNLSRYYKHVADFCHKIPDGVSMAEGAAVQPLAIAIHACNRAGVKLGSTLLILGAGPIGVLCAAAAKAIGASRIIMTGTKESRLEKAKLFGVDTTLLVSKDDPDEKVMEQIANLGIEPDISFDACGNPSAQRVAMKVTKAGGVVAIIGFGQDMVNMPLMVALVREIDIRGVRASLNGYPSALSALAKGVIDLKPFITHHFTLPQTEEAIKFAKTGDAMKIIIHMET